MKILKNQKNKIMVINAGSSSIKFQLFEYQNKQINVIWKGAAEGIGSQGTFSYNFLSQDCVFHFDFTHHEVAVAKILETMLEKKIVHDLKEIKVIGHRVVHGGTLFSQPTIINKAVLTYLESIVQLAPLHIPANLLAIKEFLKQTEAINIAVFDTAFHNTIPMLNFLFPLPWTWYRDYGVRKYGFHGISYQYLVHQISQILQTPSTKMNGIICHLGNGSSITAVKKGLSFDTSMGLTPLAGLMMGTRCGDVDPSIFQYINQKTQMSINEITDSLNYKSGFLGISNISYDLKKIAKAYQNGDQKAKLAIDLYIKKLTNYIASYFNALEGKVDYLIFSGGIGENNLLIVKKALDNLKGLSFGNSYQFPQDQNWKGNKDYFMLSSHPIPVLLVKTNEELMICQEVIKLLNYFQ